MEIEDKISELPDGEKAKSEGSTDKISERPVIEVVPENQIQEKAGEDGKNERSELGLLLSNFFKMISRSVLLRSIVRNIIIVILVLSTAVFIFSWFIYIVPAFQETDFGRKQNNTNIAELKNDPVYKKLILQVGKDTQRLKRKFTAYTPGQSYLVINTTDNRFFLYRNKKQVRDGYCSTGSYTRLTSKEGSRHWIFKTPKGRFWIQQKITSPLWVRPDWSFVEEGLPIPPPNDESRFEYGVLGDYALSLGDGYLIHGTLYKRFLGMPVTHGCVRLNDEDLETIYNTLNIGSKVFIF